MKKLLLAALAILGLSVKAEAAPIYGYVQITTSTTLTPTLQTGAINISSGSIRNLKVSTETVTTTAISSAVITNESVSVSTITTLTVSTLNGMSPSALTGVTAGYGLSGGGTTGNVTLNLNGGTTSYIQNTNSLQTGSTFYVSSGTVSTLTLGSSTTVSGALLLKNLNPGTTFDYLLSQSSATAPTWSHAGLVLQTQTALTNGVSSGTTTTAFVRTGFLVTMTPKYASSKVRCWFSGNIRSSNVAADFPFITLERNASNLAPGGGTNYLSGFTDGSLTGTLDIPASFVVQDAPASTSALTYEVYIRTSAAGATATLCSGGGCSLICDEIGQ